MARRQRVKAKLSTARRIIPFSFPDDFLIGVATAATQIEGGDVRHNWSRWCDYGHIRDGSHCSVADDHWNRVPEDVELIRRLGCGAYRLSVEWARIEPLEGRFDDDALDTYRREITLLIGAGIRPLVTLHHFTNPLWFEDSGGWDSSDAPSRFMPFVRRVVERLGDLVSDWVVINEPNVYAFESYLMGEWPPGVRSLRRYLRVSANLISAHKMGYRLVHRIRRALFPAAAERSETMVGSAIHLRCFAPATRSVPDRMMARLFEYLFQGFFVRGCVLGSAGLSLRGVGSARAGGAPLDRPVYSDFLGINYYSRDLIHFTPDPRLFFGRQIQVANVEHNDLGWEIYPEGLYEVTRTYAGRYRLPVFVTENGTADAGDTHRTRFIYDHLRQIFRLHGEKVPVQRYYHWTLMDNFEWLEGEAARFGIYAVDYETQRRTLRTSGRFFKAVCSANGVSPEMIREYHNELGLPEAERRAGA